jgi:hypothetical protein
VLSSVLTAVKWISVKLLMYQIEHGMAFEFSVMHLQLERLEKIHTYTLLSSTCSFGYYAVAPYDIPLSYFLFAGDVGGHLAAA